MPDSNPVIGFITRSDGALLLASSIEGEMTGAVGLAVIQVPDAEVDGEGEFYLSAPFPHLIKASHAQKIILSYNKRVSIRGDNGFKASLAVIERSPLPINMIYDLLGLGMQAYTIVDSNSLLTLIRMSKTMPAQPPNKLRYIRIHMDDTGLWGDVQGSELGEIEYVPLGGDSSLRLPETLAFNTDFVQRLSALMGDSVRISMPNGRQNVVLFDDPNNSADWKVLLARLFV